MRVVLWKNLTALMTKDSPFSEMLTFSSCLQVKNNLSLTVVTKINRTET